MKEICTMKKIIHAIIYGHSDGSERLVNQGEIKQIGENCLKLVKNQTTVWRNEQ